MQCRIYTWAISSCVVDDHVDAPLSLDDCLDDALDVLVARHVEGQLLDCGVGEALHGLVPARGRVDLAAAARILFTAISEVSRLESESVGGHSQGESNAALRAAGDEDYFALEI